MARQSKVNSEVKTSKLSENLEAQKTILTLDPNAQIPSNDQLICGQIIRRPSQNDFIEIVAVTDPNTDNTSYRGKFADGFECNIYRLAYRDTETHFVYGMSDSIITQDFFVPKNEPAEMKSAPAPTPEAPKSDSKPATDKKVKTQGVFQITSKFDTSVVLKGSSSQIEICTRDYMSWCAKDKAPKVLQAEYDRVHKMPENAKLTPAEIFTVTILKVCKTNDELKAAKSEFGLNPSAKATEPAEPKKPSKLMIYAQISANAKFIREMLSNGEISPEDSDKWVLVENWLNSAEETLKPMNLASCPPAPESK